MTDTTEVGDLVERLREHAHWGMPVEAAESIEQLVATCEELEAKLDDKEAECRHLRGQVGLLEAKLSAAERRERQLLDTTATCRMLRRELNTAKAKLAEVDADRRTERTER